MEQSFRNLSTTPSYARVMERFCSFAVEDASADVGHLVLALLCEESLGGKCLHDSDVTIEAIANGQFGPLAAETATIIKDDANESGFENHDHCQKTDVRNRFPNATWLREIHERASFIARKSRSEGSEVSSQHLLLAMTEVDGPAKQQLAHNGVTDEVVRGALFQTVENEPITVDFELNPNSPPEPPAANAKETSHCISNIIDASAGVRVFAVIDANLNRAREGLRVLEDFSRFVHRNPQATSGLKHLRHSLVDAEQKLRNQRPELMASRDTEADVGTGLTTKNEMARKDLTDIVTANARRVQESLRSLEEFGKTVSPTFAAAMKQLRYKSYSLEQQILRQTDDGTPTTETKPQRTPAQRLNDACLYVLVTEELCRHHWKQVVEAALRGGADIIQLREKQLNDEELIQRGRWLAETCEQHDALFILNDRVDLIQCTNAHGVHVGQDDESATQAAAQLSDEQVLGVSTHDTSQVQSACAARADYLGVGPVFSSQTKSFDEFPGLEFVSKARQASTRPWFAIGGIDEIGLQKVIDAGATRVAVCSAVIGAEDPESAARSLREKLDANSGNEGTQGAFERR